MNGRADWRELGERGAREARERAYAPYSGYQVGAAIVSADRVIVGANIENASYGATICAERVAASAAWARGICQWDGMVLVASGPVVPCGICRQFLVELAPDLKLWFVDADSGAARDGTITELVPSPFRDLPHRRSR